MRQRIVAIDGPAGAGKSTLSRMLARELGFRYLDTGAMYRVVGVLAAQRGIGLEDAKHLAEMIDALSIAFEQRADGLHTIADGEDLSRAIREPEAGQLASKISILPAVRERLVAKQREIGLQGDAVVEGRDIGTVVFPDATVKVYLTASPEERARRRCAEMIRDGAAVDLEAVTREIEERDRRDQGRAHSPLRPASDALVVDTTGKDIPAVLEQLREAVKRVWSA